MTDRDRLAAALDATCTGSCFAADHRAQADRLIALGWRKVECWCPVESPEQPGGGVNPHCPQHGTALDEERLARAIIRGYWADEPPPDFYTPDWGFEWYATPREMAARIAKAYREDAE